MRIEQVHVLGFYLQVWTTEYGPRAAAFNVGRENRYCENKTDIIYKLLTEWSKKLWSHVL